jgi:glycosyltransferase involved in cell wall biosynthesis
VKIIDFRFLTSVDLVLIGSLLFVFFIQLYFLLRYYLSLAIHKDKPGTEQPNSVTMILPVRNEEYRIREILAKFNTIEFSDYQLLVINEYSEDNTFEILNVLAETNPRLKVTSLSQETRFSEKQAINIGLKGASSPWIILVTPSIGPIHSNWLLGLNNLLDDQTDAVIAYTNVERNKGFRNLICRMEQFNQFIISGSWTLAGKPFVFSENNILFKKSLYFETLGFRHKLNRNFANLELIFNENFRKGRIKLTTNPELAIKSQIEDDRGDHVRLIKKAVQIRQSLSWSKKIDLFTDDFTRLAVPVLTTILIIMHPIYALTLASVGLVHFILFSIIVKMLINRLNERNIFISSLVYILIKPLLSWWFFWSMYVIHRRNKWN